MCRYYRCIFFASISALQLSSAGAAEADARSPNQQRQRSVLLRREAEDPWVGALVEFGGPENEEHAEQEPGGALNSTPAGGYVGGVAPFSRRRDAVVANRTVPEETIQTSQGLVRVVGNRTVLSEGPGNVLGPFHPTHSLGQDADTSIQNILSIMQPLSTMDPRLENQTKIEEEMGKQASQTKKEDDDEEDYEEPWGGEHFSTPGFISGVSLQPDPWANLGCYQRLKNDNAVLGKVESVRDATCATFDPVAEQYNIGTKRPRCRSGLPFYRLVATDLSPGVCQGYCLSKGLDLAGLVEGSECRCGATNRVQGLWGMRSLPVHLRFQEEEHQVPAGADCDIVTYMYVGELSSYLVPVEQLSRTALDYAYLQAVGCAEGGCLDPSAAP